MFACMETCFGLGLIVGPSVGGALYQAGGYLVPFVTMGACLILAACFTAFVLPAHYNERYSNHPITGQVQFPKENMCPVTKWSGF